MIFFWSLVVYKAKGENFLVLPPMKLFVLDVNGVLCSSRGKGRPAKLRPGVDMFLSTLLEWKKNHLIEVGVWTSMLERNATVILDQLFTSEEKKLLLFTWFADKCTPCVDRPFKSYKNLSQVWRVFPYFHSDNTTLFDDTEFKAQSYPQNLHLIETYNPKDSEDRVLPNLLRELQYHLNEDTRPRDPKTSPAM